MNPKKRKGQSVFELPEDLRSLIERARRVRGWEGAPSDLVEAAGTLPREGRIELPLSQNADGVEWIPVDVRSAAVQSDGQARLISRVFETGELGLVALPPAGDGRWRVQGTVWLREATAQAQGKIRVHWTHEDHILATTEAVSGEMFDLDEFVPSGWVLELNLPDGTVLAVAEPTG